MRGILSSQNERSNELMKITEIYEKIESAVVGAYKKTENFFVDGFEKISFKCTEFIFERECDIAKTFSSIFNN